MHTPFTISSHYDDEAYRTLSEASWQLFMIPRFRSRAYPVLLAVDVVLLYTIIFRPDMYKGWLLYAAMVLAVFFVAAIPLMAVRTKHGVYKKTVADAKKNQIYDEIIDFTFENKQISSAIRGNKAQVGYEDVVFMSHLNDYYLLFFSQGGYILPTISFKTEEERADFEDFLCKKVGLPMVEMSKKYF